MTMPRLATELAENVRRFVRTGFKPQFGERAKTFPSHGLWRRMRQLGTELWLDTGSLDEAGPLWTREFSALTTNNTLLNREVQTGRYDDLIRKADQLLADYPELSGRERTLELAFILNAFHGLRLVEQFDAHVSVEEHTDLATDVDAAVEYAHRYYAICPERFIVKIPLTPAGLLATRRLAAEGIPINHTLGFGARQNYVVTRLAAPRYVNVFLGRLNSFVAENRLGDGTYVGERATVASQAAVRDLRFRLGAPTRQIGASFREAGQVRDLVGMDVMTIPPKVAKGFVEMGLDATKLADRMRKDYRPPLAPGVDPAAIRLDTLWNIGRDVVTCVDAIENEDVGAFSPEDLVDFFARHGCGDVFPRWTPDEVATSAKEGKIPRLENWRDALASRRIGLDSLMNLAGLNSFIADQKAMDEHVAVALSKTVG